MNLRQSAIHICCFMLLVSFATACTDDVGNNGANPTEDTNITELDTTRPPPPDIGTDADKSDTTPDSPDSKNDTDPGDDIVQQPTNTQFELCILGSHEPTAPECLTQTYLDFEFVPFKALAERRVSIENTGDARIEVTDIDFGPTVASDITMEIVPYRLITDPASPSRKIRDPSPKRTRLQPGETLFIDVRAQAASTAGFIPAESLRIHTDVEDDDENFITIIVPLEGEVRACPAQTASCDGLAKTGCETNTTNDLLHCGGCGNECSFVNIDSACVNSTCEMVGQCSPGFGRCDKNPLSGCSTLLIDNDDHCGACDRSCARANGDGTCNGASCEATCRTGFADCNGDLAQDNSDGCEINTHQDPNHCGGCGQKCTIPNAVNLCTGTGTCSFTECQPGFFDMDNNPANGCEYQCVPSAGEDRPADNTAFGYTWQNNDKNCDGIDGDASRALFVATNGDDGNPGTRALPMRTIQAAIDRIANTSTTMNQIYVSAGTYNEQITLRSGISVYGGFSRANGWERSPSHVTSIENLNALDSGNVIAVKGNGINGARLQNFTIRSGGANSFITGTNQGASSYGVHCVSCTDLALVGNKITAGVGAPGKDGATGSAGEPGGTGSPGLAGHHNKDLPGAGGKGGTSSCGRPGGDGGRGGSEGANQGYSGADGTVNVRGGDGGVGGDPGQPGKPGATSNITSASGSSGAGGDSSGSFTNYFWIGSVGKSGGQGDAGHGGGGGGGGGGQGCFWCDNGSGNGGGGGGAGGCGGKGGYGGSAGGGSFGIVLANSTNALISNNTILTATGGRGGSGGKGGDGGKRGDKGIGAVYQSSEIGNGGDGGYGTAGGNGGYGGGGSGGPSIPVVTSGSSIQGNLETANTLTPGTGGAGGTGGNNGATGLSTKSHSL